MTAPLKRAPALLGIGFALGVGMTSFIFWLMLSPNGDQPKAPAPGEQPSLSTRSTTSAACRIAGTVENQDAEPLTDATVYLEMRDADWADPAPPIFVQVDNNGRYEFDGIYDVDEVLIWAHAPSYATVSADQPVCDGSTDLVLEAGVEFTLTVSDDSGPIAALETIIGGATLWPAREAATDENGTLHLVGLAPGAIEIWAHDETHAAWTPDPVVIEENKAQLELKAEKARSVELTITNQEGTPLNNVPITVSPNTGSLLRRVFKSTDGGRVSIDGIPASQERLVVSTIGVFAPVDISIAGVDHVSVEFDTGSSLNGTVKTSGGLPVPGVEIEATLLGDDASATAIGGTDGGFLGRLLNASYLGLPPLPHNPKGEGYLTGPPRIPLPRQRTGAIGEDGAPLPWQPSNSNGQFVLNGLPNGNIRLKATHAEYVLRRSVTAQVVDGLETEPVLLEMVRGSTAAVRVVDERDEPLDEAELIVYDATEQIVADKDSGPSGIVELRGLPAVYRVVASMDGRVSAYRDVRDRLGRHNELQLSLTPADAEIRGRVLNRDGNGVPGVFITARSITRGRLHSLAATTESDGSFVLEGAGRGSYHIIADAGDKGRAQIGDATSDEEADLVLGSGAEYAPPTAIGPALTYREPSSGLNFPSGDNLAVPAQDAETGSLSATRYGTAEDLVVTGPPSGRGGLPITLISKGGRVVISRVEGGTRVSEAGLKRGQTLVAVDGRKVRGPSQARSALEGSIGSVVMLEVKTRSGDTFTVVVQRERIR